MPVIEVERLTYFYCQGTPYAKKALDNLSFSVEQGEFLGIVGANGSGKSTLIQHFNGLLCPNNGKVLIFGRDTADREHRGELWKRVGLVFQFPEQQLFAETVADELAYGLKNLGVPQEESRGRIRSTLEQVGLNPDEVAALSPLVLSGGMRRRVALATVLVMQPEILVLDEPTAGLDGPGREAVMGIVKHLQREKNTTVIMVSHSLRELLPLVDRLIVLTRGKMTAWGTPEEVLGENSIQNLQGIGLPDYLRLVSKLEEHGVRLDSQVVTFADCGRALDRLLRGRSQ